MTQQPITKRRATAWLTALFALSFLLASAGLLIANNQWSCWHWNKSTIGVTNANPSWSVNTIGNEVSQWDAGTCVSFSGTSDITANAAEYGTTGWLGLASIDDYDASTCAIIAASALMNRTYLDTSDYPLPADQHVTCQEIGHCLGLDHRHGPFNQTCMNDVFGWFPNFDSHDAAMIDSITIGGDCNGGGGGHGREKGPRKCTDGIDNDGDGLIDAADPDCQ